jgi:hypothetical protein
MLKSSPYTHNQLAVMQDNGAATSAFVGAHVIDAAMDTESAVVSLFEQWIPELSPEAVECFRVLQTEYTAPKDLAWMLSRREVIIEAKAALDRCEITFREYVAKNQLAGGVPGWPPPKHPKRYSVRLIMDIRSSKLTPIPARSPFLSPSALTVAGVRGGVYRISGVPDPAAGGGAHCDGGRPDRRR